MAAVVENRTTVLAVVVEAEAAAGLVQSESSVLVGTAAMAAIPR